jgi:hypothetical protein
MHKAYRVFFELKDRTKSEDFDEQEISCFHKKWRSQETSPGKFVF